MDRNALLGIVGVVAIGIVGALLFLSPQEKNPVVIEQKMQQRQASQEDVDIEIEQQESSSKIVMQKEKRKKSVSKKKRDPSIKAATIDHYHTYLIQLIDENPEDRDIKLEKDPNSYRYVDGKVDGKEFVMRVPKAVVDRPGIKLKITNLKTKEHTIVDASFLSELDSLPRGGSFHVDIDTKNPNNVQTQAELPDEYSPFPSF